MGLFGPNVKRLESRRDVAGLQAVVRTGSLKQRWDAAAALGRLGETAALVELADQRPVLSDDIRQACASALATIDDPAAESWLEKAVTDADERVRETAARRLAGKLKQRLDADVNALYIAFAAKVTVERDPLRPRSAPAIAGFYAGCDPDAAWWVSPTNTCKVRHLGDAGSPEVAIGLAKKLAAKFVDEAYKAPADGYVVLGRRLPAATPNTKLSTHVTPRPSGVYMVTIEEKELMGVGFVVA